MCVLKLVNEPKLNAIMKAPKPQAAAAAACLQHVQLTVNQVVIEQARACWCRVVVVVMRVVYASVVVCAVYKLIPQVNCRVTFYN